MIFHDQTGFLSGDLVRGAGAALAPKFKNRRFFKANARESDQHRRDERDDIVTDALQPEITL
jgi:hypothetical protein